MRRLAIVIAGGVIALSGPAAPAQQTRTIVFVCEHGSAKSVIAAAHFNRMAKEKGLPYQAVARGVRPDKEIPANVRGGLAADGVDVTAWKPALVRQQDIERADQVVTFACRLPASVSTRSAKIQEWNDVPAVSENYSAARQTIVGRIQSLLSELSALHPAR